MIGELKRLVAHPLSPRHVSSFTVLPTLPSVQGVLPEGAGPTRTVRAIVEILARAIQDLEGRTVRIQGLSPLHLDATTVREVVSDLRGITKQGQTDFSNAVTRRGKAAEAMGFGLD